MWAEGLTRQEPAGWRKFGKHVPRKPTSWGSSLRGSHWGWGFAALCPAHHYSVWDPMMPPQCVPWHPHGQLSLTPRGFHAQGEARGVFSQWTGPAPESEFPVWPRGRLAGSLRPYRDIDFTPTEFLGSIISINLTKEFAKVWFYW